MRIAQTIVVRLVLGVLLIAMPARAKSGGSCGAQKQFCHASAKGLDGPCRDACTGAGKSACLKQCAKSYRKDLAKCGSDARLCRRGSLQVVFSGTSTFDVTLTDSDGGETVQSSFQWSTTYDHLLLNPFGHRRIPTDFPSAAFASDGTSNGTFTVHVGGGTPCDGTGGLTGFLGKPQATTTPQEALAVVSATLHPDGSADLIVPAAGKVDESPAGAQDCGDINGPDVSDFWPDWVTAFGHAGLDNALGSGVTLTTDVTLTAEQLAQGKVVANVQAAPDEIPSTDCGSGDGTTCTESYGWTGTVTITRDSKL